MVFKIDFINGKTISWTKTETGAEAEHHKDYYPRFYIEGDRSKLHKSRPWLSQQEGVVATCFEQWKPTLSKPRQKVLRVDCRTEEALRTAANTLKKSFGRSTFQFYNVGFSPQFRFCLQKQVCPKPEKELTKTRLDLPRKHLSNRNISNLRLDGERLGGGEKQVLKQVQEHWRERSPDLIIVNRGQVLLLLKEKISEYGLDFSLGRINKFQELADDNTVSSYGKRQHKAARYNLPGRIIIDRSNSFMLGEATLEGLWDLVERSYRPMQELAWGSIGRLLTSIEVKKAYLEENTLTPWKNWEGEKPKKASTLHKADRGGFIFNPEPSIHEDVYEADFASLFPNIMIEKNISPETVCCSCCDNKNTPELDYSICEKKEGFIGKVLKPLVEDRQEMKEKIDDIEDEERQRYIQGSIDSIKWILVSCFGYMGHSHASYGAIKCHQAIQAFDRDIMVNTKEMFEESGYSVAHGIIDSIWVQKKPGAEDFEQVCQNISSEIGIELEPENKFEWCAFVPRSSSEANIATLNRYFGKKQNGEFKTAGIEVEQKSTCQYVKNCQMELIEVLDKTMQAESVIQELKDQIRKLEAFEVPVESLVKQKKVSKTLEAYKVNNRSVSALKRARYHGIEVKPGQSVRFVVRDDDADAMDRTRLDFEASVGEYDPDYYRTELVRAAESILSPIGLDREDISSRLSEGKSSNLADYLWEKEAENHS
ncbi:MAG: type B DNA-directed DNA polymerase [Candidatus Nanohaloarchaea archaeon]